MKFLLSYILLIIVLAFGLFVFVKSNNSEENVKDESYIKTLSM
ncbi:hypothetical protein [Sutcliffiella horikoshii]|nr:hypothetical protein [Sutcliffiella horikoshii]